MNKRIVILWLLALYSLFIYSSINVRSHFLSSENGLEANYIRSIVQDERGYIWMGATNGLIRYDGYNARLIRPDSTARRLLMTDDRVLAVDLWLDRFVWVRLRGQHYCCYDTEQDAFVDYTGDGTYNESYRHYFILPNGELWLYDNKQGCKIITFDGQHFSYRRETDDSQLPVEAKPTLTTSQAHLLTAGRELVKDNLGNTVVVEKEGQLWHIDRKTGRITHLTDIYSRELLRLNGSPRYSVVTDLDGLIWVSTYGNGLFIHNPKTGTTTHFLKIGTSNAPIQTNYLLSIYEDREGNIWACQENMGIACISKQPDGIETRYLNDAERIDHSNSVHLLCRIGEQIYVGNRFNELWKADGQFNMKHTETQYDDDIVAACMDRQGTVWLGTRNNGIYAGEKNYHHLSDDSTTLSKGKISDIVCDQQGRLWISVFDGTVDVAIPDSKGGYTFQHLFTGEHAVKHPRKMTVDKGGYLWLCSDEGIYTFHPDQLLKDPTAYQRFLSDEEKEATEVHCIIETQSGYIIAGSSGKGVYLIDNTKVGKPVYRQHFTTADGLPDNNIQQILEDKQHNIWMGTDRGLARFDMTAHNFLTLMPASTLQGNMFIENAACMLDNGRLAFGSRHGINIIDPNLFKAKSSHFNLRLTDMEINGVSIYNMDEGQLSVSFEKGEPISLSYNENSVVFRFSNFEYAEADQTRYTYRLIGYDNDWQPLQKLNFAIYKNLEPGDYTLELRTQNASGQWNEETVRQCITINPPLWATWWAFLLYILIVTGAILLVYRHIRRINDLRNRIKVETQLTEFKIRFFTNVSHEYRTPLTIIRGTIEKLANIEGLPATAKQPLSSMQKSVKRMMRLTSQLMEFSRLHENRLQLHAEPTDVVAFVRDIVDAFHEIASDNRITLQFVPFTQQYEMLADQGFLDKITYNLVSNAFKYTPTKGSIFVRIKLSDNGMMQLIVEDTGIGITPEKQAKLFSRFNQNTFASDSVGLGLHLTSELVAVHHGTIEYQQREGGGSIFTVSLPTDKAVYAPNELLSDKPGSFMAEEKKANLETLDSYHEMTPEPMNDRTVLVVDDDGDVCQYLSHELQRYFHIETASNGQEALQRTGEHCPDLIVTDLVMPIMDGLELTRLLRKNPETNSVPVIMLTAQGNETEDFRLKSIEAGVQAYVEKPFSMKMLVTLCCKTLEQHMRMHKHYAQSNMPQETRPAEIIQEEKDRKFREKLDAWMNMHLSDSNLNIDQFAQSLGYGRTTFFKQLKKVTGQTPNDYIRTMRMQAAANLLMENERLTIAEVAYRVGFSDQYYFSKSFKQYYGQSPTVYRQQHV